MFPDESKPLHIVNFSGGKDSTYMLLEMIRRGIYFDMVINVDTGMEFPAMYDHIAQVERFLQAERGMSITRLHPPRSFEELMFQAVKETAEPGDIPGYGWPAIKVRWCTGHLKVHLISRYLSGLPVQPYHYIAFAADEGRRLERKNNQDVYKRYPLVAWGVTEAQALAGCYEAGYTWDGLYEQFSRVSCWCCPLQSLAELRVLEQFHPDLWARLRDMDDRAIEQFGRGNPYGQFKEHESVRMLEYRFALERTWAEAGGNIRSRAFFRELKRQYEERFFPGGHYFTGPQYVAPVDRLLAFVEDEDLSLYGVDKLDKLIDQIIRIQFERIRQAPPQALIEREAQRETTLAKAQLNMLMEQHRQKEREYQDLRAETIKVVQGTSRLNADLLNSLVEETKAQIAELEQQIEKGKEELKTLSSDSEKVRQEYAQLVSWADMYDSCTFEAKKMIVAQFVKSVSVKRDYEIDITFNVSFAEFQGIYLEPETEEEKQSREPMALTLTEIMRQAV